jgi:ABC-2 type transport system ATP-binding protein
MSVIEIKNLKKTFGSFTALEDVDLTVEKGKIHGFIGPNGAGKSTTIRILLGMLKADTGKVTIFDKDAWADAVEIHKRVAYVPGDANLWPNLTGGQVIDLLLNMRNQSADTKRRDELMELFEFDPRKKCREYSKGNLQKVLIIAAFAADADVFILDEPTSGLDPLMERKFQSHLLELKKAGKTILLSSHILSEVEKLCDTVSIIRRGSVIETGTLDELRHLTRMNFEVETDQPIKPIENLEKIDGVHQVEQDGTRVTFQVDTEYTNQVVQFISQYQVIHLSSSPPKLEDLFIRYYDESKEGVGQNE